MNVDYKVLFTPLTDEVARDGMEFYTTFFHAPPAIKVCVSVLALATPEPHRHTCALQALMHAVMGVGIIGLVGKLIRMDDSAKWFDGSSLGAYPSSVWDLVAYTLSPNPPTAAYIFALSVYLSVGLPASRTIATPVEGVDTREDQIEALRLLSAGNTIIIALLGMVLALQVRCWCPLLEALTSCATVSFFADCPFCLRSV